MKIESVVVNIDWTKEVKQLSNRIRDESKYRTSNRKANKIAAITTMWLLFFAIILSFCMLFDLTVYANGRTVVSMWVLVIIFGIANCVFEVNGRKDFYVIEDEDFEEIVNYDNSRKTDFVTKEYARLYLFDMPHLDLVSQRILLSKAILEGKCSVDYDSKRFMSAVTVCNVDSSDYTSFSVDNSYLVNPYLDKGNDGTTVEFTINKVNVYQNIISQEVVRGKDINYNIKEE